MFPYLLVLIEMEKTESDKNLTIARRIGANGKTTALVSDDWDSISDFMKGYTRNQTNAKQQTMKPN
jgi:hypothetical protein